MMQNCPVCPRCSSNYIIKDSGWLPLLLQCGHTFCESCLLQLACKGKTSIICPICQHETQLQSGETSVKDLCIDRYIIGAVQQNQKFVLEQEMIQLEEACSKSVPRRRTHSDKICQECSKKPASSYCQNCECLLCTVCFQKVHSLSKSLGQHKQLCLTEEGQPEVTHTCSFHVNQPLEYYCENDDTIMCARCAILGNHKGHTFTALEAKNQSFIREMEPSLQMANHVHKRLKRIDKELLSVFPDCKKDVDQVLNEITLQFQRLHGLLQVRQYNLESQVVKILHDRHQPLEKLRSDLHYECRELEHTIKDAQQMINKSDGVIVNAKGVLEKLDHARDIPCFIEQISAAEYDEKIVFDSGTSIDSSLMEFGTVLGSLPQRFTIQSIREKPEYFTEDVECQTSTPDNQSVILDVMSHSEDIIIEEVQERENNISSKNIEEEPKLVKTKALQLKSPLRSKIRGQNECVYVTHINTPNRFIVQLKSDAKKLAALSSSVQKWVNNPASNKHMVTGVAVDDLVLARYSKNNQWYRARVKHVIHDDNDNFEKTKAEVHYIDYGNIEVVSVKNLRNMQTQFMKHPEFSMECCLYNLTPREKGGSWSLDAVKEFVKIVENKPMLLTIIREDNNVNQVDLSKPPDDDIANDRPMSVRDALVFLELANLESPFSLEPAGAPAPKRNYLAPTPKEIGDMYPVLVSYAGTPDCFYVQELGDDIDYLAKMMVQLQDMYNRKMRDTWKIICPQLGMICVSQFTGDNLWYRARIVGLPGNKEVDVLYVDYGNIERVTCLQICKILDSFLVLPAQALCCRLTDVAPYNMDEGWSAQSLRYWSEKVTLKPFNMKVISVGFPLGVVLKEPDDYNVYKPMNMKIVEDGFARSVGGWSSTQNAATCMVTGMPEIVPRLSYQIGSGSFPEHCDLSHAPVYWKSRNCKPTCRYNEETVFTPPNSQHFIKNQSLREHSTKSQLLSKPIPMQGLDQSNIHGLGNGLKTGSISKETSLKSHQIANVQKATNASSQEAKIKECDPNGKLNEIKSKNEVEVLVSHFVSPSEFSLQLVGQMDDLNKLMVDLNNTYPRSKMKWKTWCVGEHCAIMSPTKGVWCRGKVTKVIQKNLMEILIMDYGFSEITSTSNLRKLLHQYRKMRVVSFPCKLTGLLPAGGMQEWSKTACEFMQDFVSHKKLYVCKQGNPENQVSPVDLIVEEYVEETALEPGRKVFHSLTEHMKEAGLAIPMLKNRHDLTNAKKILHNMYYMKADANIKTGDVVMPVYVDCDAGIHCHNTMDRGDIFQSMCDELQSKFKDSEPHGNNQKWFKGQAVGTYCSKDKQWYRATVLQVNPDKVQIFYIDYGRTEWVRYELLRADVEEFTNIPQQAFLCVLHDIKPRSEDDKWDGDAIEFLHKEVVNHYCTVTVVEKYDYMTGHATVNLERDGVDIGSKLVQYGMAKRGEFITDQILQSALIENMLMNSNPFKTMSVPMVGESFPITVSHLELPNIVYIQHVASELTSDMDPVTRQKVKAINEQLDSLVRLTRNIRVAAPTLASITDPKKGLACCAQYTCDNMWYRAVIVDTYPDTGQFLVLFVDYGNSEMVTLDRLLTLPPSLSTLPCQAFRCCVAHVKPSSGVVSWTKNSLLEMMKVVIHKELVAKVRKHNPLTVELYENARYPCKGDVLIYQPLIDSGCIGIDVSEASIVEEKIDDSKEQRVTMEIKISDSEYIDTKHAEQSVVIPVKALVNSMTTNDVSDINEKTTHKPHNITMKKLIRSPVHCNVAIEALLNSESLMAQTKDATDAMVSPDPVSKGL